MHLDLRALQHVHGHFMSDTVNPTDVIRLTQSSSLRLPPGSLTKWAVVRSAGRNIPQYVVPLCQVREQTATPSGAHWREAVVHDLKFILRANMIGILGLSGDLASLSEENLEIIRSEVNFYKEWSSFIVNAAAILLTAPEVKSKRDGWAAIQLHQPGRKETLLFVYRLDDAQSSTTIRLRGLDADAAYTIRSIDREHDTIHLMGADLMLSGLEIRLPEKLTSTVYVVS
jgi:alpha-galactosidase